MPQTSNPYKQFGFASLDDHKAIDQVMKKIVGQPFPFSIVVLEPYQDFAALMYELGITPTAISLGEDGLKEGFVHDMNRLDFIHERSREWTFVQAAVQALISPVDQSSRSTTTGHTLHVNTFSLMNYDLSGPIEIDEPKVYDYLRALLREGHDDDSQRNVRTMLKELRLQLVTIMSFSTLNQSRLILRNLGLDPNYLSIAGCLIDTSSVQFAPDSSGQRIERVTHYLQELHRATIPTPMISQT